MNIIKKTWSDISTEPISEEAIRTLHQPHDRFKLYVNTHEAGKRFPAKAGHAFVLYVLTGSCKTTVDGKELVLHAAEFAMLEQGAYTFETVGEDELKLVKVFSLT